MNYCADSIPVWTEEKKVLIRSQLNIPALHMIGHSNLRAVSVALIPHYHHTMEFVVMLKGRQQYMVKDRIYDLKGGDVFMTFPEEIHSTAQYPQQVHECIWFQIDLSSPENFLGLSGQNSFWLYQQFCRYHTRLLHTSQKDVNRLRQAFQLLSAIDQRSRLLGHSHFLEFVIGNLCTEAVTEAETAQFSDLQTAIDYIHTHLTNNPTLETLSRLCNMSPSVFIVKFKEALGLTPHAYITNLKLDTARSLLKNTDLSVTEIALQLGFSSGNHFSAVFKKRTGFSPTQYRR